MENSSFNLTANYSVPVCPLFEAHGAVKGFIAVISCLLILFSVFGNTLVCLVVIRRPKMRTVINIFICNLAVGDLIYTVMGFPINITTFFTKDWVPPQVLCQLSQAVPALSIFISSLTLTAIAVDRFCLVVYPLLKPINKRRCYATVAFIWIISIALTLPVAVHVDIVDFSKEFNRPIKLCFEFWSDGQARKHYSVAMFLIQFCYPLLLVTVAHTCISVKLSRNVRPGMRRRESEYRENRRRQRMNRMLSAVVAVFAVCWSPFNVITLLHELHVDMGDNSCIIFMTAQLIAASNTIMNPILYGWLNDNFRKEFHRILPFLTCLEDLMPVVASKSTTGAVSGSNINGNSRARPGRPTGGTYLQPTAAESTVSRTTPVLNTRKLPVEDTQM